MQESVFSQLQLSTLSNPFDVLDVRGNIIGRVSGRSTDIRQIISEGQSEIVLAGAPTIGKSTLINYLQLPLCAEWSWRNELAGSLDQQKLDNTHFVQIDLAHLEGIEDKNDLLNTFISRCASALHQAYKKEKPPS